MRKAAVSTRESDGKPSTGSSPPLGLKCLCEGQCKSEQVRGRIWEEPDPGCRGTQRRERPQLISICRVWRGRVEADDREAFPRWEMETTNPNGPGGLGMLQQSTFLCNSTR